MEERIQEIIRSNSPESVLPLADGVLGFAHHQIIELARDCLEKSRLGLITSSYFCELTDKLERLVQEVSVSSVTVEMRSLGGTGHGNAQFVSIEDIVHCCVSLLLVFMSRFSTLLPEGVKYINNIWRKKITTICDLTASNDPSLFIL